jgi:hypothetical protein
MISTKTMTIEELIRELQKYDKSLEIVTCDGYGSVDAILQVSIRKIDNTNNIVEPGYAGEATDAMVLGWNI